MLIVGAKGFAKEVLEVLYQIDKNVCYVFYDDVTPDITEYLFNRYPILKSETEVKDFFENKPFDFTIGVGDPTLREKLFAKFSCLGGVLQSTISPLAIIGNFGNSIASGVNIMSGAVVTSGVTLGKGVLINLNATIGHDSYIGDFAEISPSCNVSGNCHIGKFSVLGTGAVVLPKVKIGEHSIIGAGAVVTKDVPDFSLAVGVPAQVIKSLI
jgi:sugar O-acyltransferase (sialic acid O-acetyltransferase NeuD family)